MKTARTSKQVVGFERFELDLQSGELLKNGRKLKLPEQPFQVLSLLVAHPGELVTREELRQKLWPADTFVDFDHSLNAAVNKLRETLGDSAAQPRFVETMPRRGYRFIAPVEDKRLTEAAAPEVPSGRRRGRLWLSVAGLALLAGTSWWSLSEPTKDAPRVVPLTTYQGSEGSPSFSPDGSQVAFVWDGKNQDNRDIYVKVVGSETAYRITNDPAEDLSPAWSPDGRYIAFVRRDVGGTEVYLISPLGEGEQRIARLTSGYPGPQWSWRQLAWSPDGEFLAVADRHSPSGPYGIFLLSVETGNKRQLISLSRGDEQPSFSPDGGALGFVQRTWGGHLYVMSLAGTLAGTATKQITFDPAIIHGLAWTSDGRELVFSSDHDGSRGLWRVLVSGGRPRRLGEVGLNAAYPEISSQGDRLAFVHFTRDINIWQRAVPQTYQDDSAPQELIASTWQDSDPVFSPDGKRILFCSNRTGSSELWICDRGGSNPLPLTSFGGPAAGSPSWSPDSSKIAFDSAREGNYDIYVIHLEEDTRLPRPITLETSSDAAPMWSHDGRWIYFQSDQTGRDEIWRVPAEGGASEQVTTHGGMRPLVAPDGNSIYYGKQDSDRAWSVWKRPLEGAEETQVLPSLVGLDWDCSVVVDRGIYLVVLEDLPTGERQWFIKFLDFRTKQLSRTLSLKNPLSHTGGLAISPDQRWFLYAQAESKSDLMLIENFR